MIVDGTAGSSGVPVSAARSPDELEIAATAGQALAGFAAPASEEVRSALFGRGLVYVALLSVQVLAATVTSPILAHLLPPAQFGELATAIALHQVLVVFAVVGLDQALVQVRGQSGDDRPARTLVLLALVLASLLTGLAAVTSPMWGSQLGFAPNSSMLITVVGWTLPASSNLVVSALLMIQDRLRAFALLNVLSAVGGQLAGLLILAVGGYRTADAYAFGGLVSLSVTLVLGLVFARPRWVRHGGAAIARRGLALGVPLMVSGLAIYVLNAGDRLVIQRVLGPGDAGRYQIAYTVGNLAILLLSMISAAWAPRITEIADEDRRWALVGSARDGLIRLMTPVMLGITLGAPLVLIVVAPGSYRQSTLLPVVFLVALAGFPVLAGSGTGRALATLERNGALAWSAVIAAVGNLGLNVVLVPRLGVTGAALATLIAFVVQAVLHRVWLPQRIDWPSTPARVLVPACLSVAVSAATLGLPQSEPWNFGRFAVAAACLPWFAHRLLVAQGRPGLQWRRGRSPSRGPAAVPEPMHGSTTESVAGR